MTVIDIRDNPRLDMEMAQSISNILKSVGRMEQNRQKRYRLDQMMSDINSGADPMTALQDASNTKAPYGEGLAGVGQRIGGFLGGHTQNLTDAMIEKSFINKLSNYQKQQDPMYQAQLAASKAGTGYTEAKTEAIPATKVKKSRDNMIKWSSDLSKIEEEMDPALRKVWDDRASAHGLVITETDTTDHSKHVKGEDGMWYRKNEDGTAGNRIFSSIKYGLGQLPETPPPINEAPPTQPASTNPPVVSPPKTDKGFGDRPDGTKKGKGFLGVQKLKGGGVASEYSISTSDFVDENGKEIDFPTLVPTLTKAEIRTMTQFVIPKNKPVPKTIERKALAHARKRKAAGLSTFWEPEAHRTTFDASQAIPGNKPKVKAEAPSAPSSQTVSIQNEKGVSEGKFTVPSGKTLFKKKDGSFVTIPDKNIEGYMKANPGVIRYQIGE